MRPISVTSLRCEGGASVIALTLSDWSLEVPHGTSWLSEDLKKQIVALHKDGLGYKKIAKP